MLLNTKKYEYLDEVKFYQIRAAVQLLLYNVDVRTILAYIYELYQDYLISDTQEEILYKIADLDDEFNSPSEYFNALESDDNPLKDIAFGRKEVVIKDK